MENLSYALDSYGRPVLCETDLLHSNLTSGRPLSRTGQASRGLKPFLSEEHLTREEKAARIRAEIARRKEQLINSEIEARLAEAAAEDAQLARDSQGPFYDVDGYPLEQGRYADEIIGYEGDPLVYDPGQLGRRRRGLRARGPLMTRSFDAAYGDYYDELAYEDELYYNQLRERGIYDISLQCNLKDFPTSYLLTQHHSLLTDVFV